MMTELIHLNSLPSLSKNEIDELLAKYSIIDFVNSEITRGADLKTGQFQLRGRTLEERKMHTTFGLRLQAAIGIIFNLQNVPKFPGSQYFDLIGNYMLNNRLLSGITEIKSTTWPDVIYTDEKVAKVIIREIDMIKKGKSDRRSDYFIFYLFNKITENYRPLRVYEVIGDKFQIIEEYYYG